MKNWKTTAAGLLSAFIATVGPVAAYLANSHWPKAATACGILTLAGAIARIWVGLIQKDANPAVSSSVTIETIQPVQPSLGAKP